MSNAYQFYMCQCVQFCGKFCDEFIINSQDDEGGVTSDSGKVSEGDEGSANIADSTCSVFNVVRIGITCTVVNMLLARIAWGSSPALKDSFSFLTIF